MDGLDAFNAYLGDEIVVGVSPETGRPITVSLDDLKATSVHVIGAAGTGKSYWLRGLIDQFMEHRLPFGVLDPHSELCDYALHALTRSATHPERVVLVDPSDREFSVGFNPLCCGVSDPVDSVGLVMDSFLKAWGARSFDETPRLEGLLRGMLRLLIDNKLTLLEGYRVLDVDDCSFRRALRENVSDPFVRQDFERFELLPRHEKLAVAESTVNRLRRLLQDARIQLMLAQTHKTLNLRRVLDEGQYLLASLGGISSRETQRLLGALLLNGIFAAGKSRDSRSRRQYFLIVDECGEFVTSDVAASLDQLRKFGVGLILSHQRLRQLQKDDADVLSAVMTNAKIKVVFGGLELTEAEVMSRELFTGQVSGDKVKHRNIVTKFRPIADTFEVRTTSTSSTEGEGESDTFSESEGMSDGESWNESRSFDGDPLEYRTDDECSWSDGQGGSRLASRSSSSGRSRSRQQSETHGESTSVVPITRHEEFEEESGRSYYSLAEEWESHIAAVHGLSKRQAFLKVYNQPPQRMMTVDVEPEWPSRATTRYFDRVRRESPYLTPVEEVTKAISLREERIKQLVENTESAGRPFEPTTFREPLTIPMKPSTRGKRK